MMAKLIDSNPLVSVVIPTYNNANLIVETLNSVQNQTYQNLEIIVVDDGSTDNTEKVVRELIKSAPQLSYHKIENSFSPTARNFGLKLAKGDYVTTVDSDDLWPKNRIELQLKALNDNPAAIVVGCVQRFSENSAKGRQLDAISCPPSQEGDYIHNLLTMHNSQMVNFNTLCAKRSIICSDGLWDPGIITAHDWENWIRLAKKHPFIHLDEVLQLYRKHEASTTVKNKSYKALRWQLRVVERHARTGVFHFWKKLYYRRLRYESFIGVFLYENKMTDAIKLWLEASTKSNLLFSKAGLRQLVEIGNKLLRPRAVEGKAGNV